MLKIIIKNNFHDAFASFSTTINYIIIYVSAVSAISLCNFPTNAETIIRSLKMACQYCGHCSNIKNVTKNSCKQQSKRSDNFFLMINYHKETASTIKLWKTHYFKE